MFGNCSYYDCDSSQIYIHFTPASVEPGGSTIIKLWITPNQYEYNEDNYDILQKTITIEPECGQLTYLGGGEYLFTAPDTLTVDSTVVIINYENYNQFCARWNAEGERMIVKDNFDCINCPMPLFNILQRDYAAEQLTIKWDSLFVEVNPTELFPGDTADINIKKRLPDGTLTDFDTTQTFEAAMLEGCTLGNILVDDSIDVYFYDINQPIKFVADTTADSTGLVLLRIGLVEEIAMLKSNNDEDVLFDCLPGPPQTSNYAIVQAYINEEPTILLGETKYYQARYKTVRWREDSGGCIHGEIAKHFPELAPFIKWHLCSSDGPLHYVANTVYLAGDRDCWGLRRGEGKDRELSAARRAAIWPDATDEDLTAPGLEQRLEARLPALLAEFRKAVESLGFVF